MNGLWKKYNLDNVETVYNSGVVYVIEYGDCIKIGSTQNITERYKQLYKQATDYCNVTLGDCYYTVYHEKYKNTELLLHKLLNEYRKQGTELFYISITNFFNIVKNIEIDISKNNNDKSEIFIDWAKNYMVGKFNIPKYYSFDKSEINAIFRQNYCTYCDDSEFAEIMDIINKINTKGNTMTYFIYLLTKMQNIIFHSQERYLETLI